MVDTSKEIRKLLRGEFVVKDGITIALEDFRLKNIVGWQGYLNGTANVNTLGVSSAVTEFSCDDTVEDPLHDFMRVLIKYGQLAALASKPDAVGFLATHGLGNTMLFVLEETEWGHMKISYYTARTATSAIVINRAMKLIEAELPSGAEKVENTETESGKKKHKK